MKFPTFIEVRLNGCMWSETKIRFHSTESKPKLNTEKKGEEKMTTHLTLMQDHTKISRLLKPDEYIRVFFLTSHTVLVMVMNTRTDLVLETCI